jgi:hypothetical protein
MSENKTESLDLGAMMEQTLDTIPDAPDFSNPPAGEYNIDVKECKVDKYKTKDDPNTEKQRLKLTYSVAETISVAGNEQPVPDGSLFTETFQATELGLGYFKNRIKAIMNVSDLAGVSLADMMASVKGMQFKCRISVKKSPNPKGGEYENLQIRVIAPTA